MLMTNASAGNGAMLQKTRRVTGQRLAQAPVARRAARRHIQVCVMGLGGSASALAGLSLVEPELLASALVVDCDLKMEVDLATIPDRMLLSGGDLQAIREYQGRYSFYPVRLLSSVKTIHLPPHGVGKVRPLASVHVAYHLDDLKMRVRRLVERTLAKFKGSMPKRLVIHLVFSLGGGTGSALALPCAALVLDAARSIAPSLRVSLIAHVIAPSLFMGMLATPADRERNLANGAITLRELRLAQRPENLVEFARALHIAPIRRPLFDGLSYYDLADSGNAVQALPEVWERIAANIIMSANPSLDGLEQARDRNSIMAQSVDSHDPDAAVIRSEHATAARVPVAKIVNAFTARELHTALEEAGRPASGQQVQGIKEQCSPQLGLEELQRRALNRLQPDHTSRLPASMDKLSDRELAHAGEKLYQRWQQRGRQEMRQKAASLRRELERDALVRAAEFTRAAAARARSVPEYAAVLREAIDELEDRKGQAQRRLEALAAADAANPFRKAGERLQRKSLPFFGQGTRHEYRRTLDGVLNAEAEEAARRQFCEQALNPMIAALAAELEQVERLGQALDAVRQQLEFQIPLLEEGIGVRTGYITEVIAPEEVSSVLDRLAVDIPASAGPLAGLRLARLLQAGGEEEFKGLLDEAAEQIRERALRFFEKVKDIKEFLKHFSLRFDLEAWLAESLEVTLPTQLQLAPIGPGNAPLRPYLLAPESLKDTCEGIIRRGGNHLGFDFCAGEDPFELVCRAKIAGVPFCSVPGLEDMDRAFESFQKAASGGHVWWILPSHDSLQGAMQISFQPQGGDVGSPPASQPPSA